MYAYHVFSYTLQAKPKYNSIEIDLYTYCMATVHAHTSSKACVSVVNMITEAAEQLLIWLIFYPV